MRNAMLTLLAAILLPVAETPAQDSLCNPCVDPPIGRERPEFTTPGSSNVMTPEDMRSLGILTIADMVNQPTGNVRIRTQPADRMSVGDIFANAERAFPESGAPSLFGPGSSSAAYAGELEDVLWAPRMEARILEAIQEQRERGLVVRRTEVECRMATCAVLLVHAANRGQGSIGALVSDLRDRLGFSGVNQGGKEIPLAIPSERNPDAMQVFFMMAYAEILLTGAVQSQ